MKFICHFPVRTMGMNDRFHHILFDEQFALVVTPLIAPAITHNHHNIIYPYNLTTFEGTSLILSSSTTSTSGNKIDDKSREVQSRCLHLFCMYVIKYFY